MEQHSVLHRRVPLNENIRLASWVPRKATIQIVRGIVTQTAAFDSDFSSARL